MGGQTPPHPDASLSFAETFFRSRYHDYENDIVSDQPIDFLFGVLLAANEKKNNEKLHEALFLRSFRCFCCQPQCFRDLQSETGTRKELAERASIFRQRFVIGSFESFTLL
jgi:hypothetical protein